MIFLDTSAIYALADKADPNHADAYKKFDLALKAGEIFLLHNYVLVESAALLQARLGGKISCPPFPRRMTRLRRLDSNPSASGP